MAYDANKRPTPRRVESTRNSQERAPQRNETPNRYTSTADRRANSGMRTDTRSYESKQHYEEVRYNTPRQYRREAIQRTAQQAYYDTTKYSDPSRYSRTAGYNGSYNAQSMAARKNSRAPLITGIVVGLILIALILWFFIIPRPFDVTVNGKTVTMNPGSTVSSLIEEGFARPTPGNFVAVDGSVIAAGEGEKFSATINGSPATADSKLAGGMSVEIGNGSDITEDYTSSEEVVPAGFINDDMGFEGYWSGSIHLLQDGKDGTSATKTGKTSGKTVSEEIVPMVNGGYRIYTPEPTDKVIALTFDDGPWPGTTDEILDILEANNAKATFFTIGEQIADYAAAVKRANDMGCEVLTHSWDHARGSGQGVDMTLMSSDEQIAEVTKGYDAITSATGKEPAHIMRAPGGNFHDNMINTLWPYLDAEIGWNVDTEDWAQPGVDAIVSRILSVEPGQVILMHDGGGDRAQTVEALRKALPILTERGFKCVTISDLLAYGVPSSNVVQPAEESNDEGGTNTEYYEEEYEEE